jgi:hypothetical protein
MRPAQKKSRFRWEKHNGDPQGCGDLDKEPCPEGENLKRAHIISKVEHEHYGGCQLMTGVCADVHKNQIGER